MKYLLCLVLYLSGISITAAQSLHGSVQQGNTAAIEGAVIKVLNSEYTAITDKSGNFKIQLPPGVYTISVLASGFLEHTQSITIGKTPGNPVLFTLTQGLPNQLETVTITANRREDNILKIPGSVTRLSSQQVKDTRTWDLGNLNGIIPNYQYSNLGVGYQQQIAIRGISIFSETPATNTYIDGVLALDVTGNGFQLLDIESIEVLRGPQGTLYGRNAMGGVINIATKAPKNKEEAFVETSLGNQGLQRYGIAYKNPILKDKLYLGISGQFQKYFGFYTNNLDSKKTFDGQPLAGTPENGQRMGDEDSYYANLYLRYIPRQNLQFTFNTKFQIDQSVGASAYYQAAENPKVAVEQPYEFAVNDLGSSSRKIWNNALSVKYYHTSFNLVATTTLQHIEQAYSHIDQDLFPYDLAAGYTFNSKLGDATPNTVVSQEIRLLSPASQSRLQWHTGAYLFNQNYDKRYAAVYQDLGLLFGSKPGTEVTQTDMNNEGIAFFGQLSYDITPQLKLTAGLRYDYENRSTDVSRYYIEDNDLREYTIAPTKLKSDYNALTPKFSLQYQLRELHTIYFTYSRGFRAGGNNMFTNGKYPQYGPEYSDNYEVGYKWRSPDKNWTVASSLFLLRWKDLQLDMRPEPGLWIVNNVGDVRSMGLEVTASTMPLPGLVVDASLGLNDAEYMGFTYLGADIKGNKAILAPKSTIFLGLQQYLPLSKTTMLTLRGEWKRMGSHYFDLENKIYQPAYSLFNAKLTCIYKNFELSAWVQNISNIKYIAFAMPGYFQNSILNRPRTLGTTLSYTF